MPLSLGTIGRVAVMGAVPVAPAVPPAPVVAFFLCHMRTATATSTTTTTAMDAKLGLGVEACVPDVEASAALVARAVAVLVRDAAGGARVGLALAGSGDLEGVGVVDLVVVGEGVTVAEGVARASHTPGCVIDISYAHSRGVSLMLPCTYAKEVPQERKTIV